MKKAIVIVAVVFAIIITSNSNVDADCRILNSVQRDGYTVIFVEYCNNNTESSQGAITLTVTAKNMHEQVVDIGKHYLHRVRPEQCKKVKMYIDNLEDIESILLEIEADVY